MFGLVVLMSQWFAPTKLVITYEGSEPVEDVLERDADGNVTRIHLPEKLIIMANHQVRPINRFFMLILNRIPIF